MSYQIKQSTTAYPLVFLLVDSTDHVTAKTGLSPTVTISKAGGSFASPSGAVTEIANGWYKVAGNATDSATLGPLILHATGTAADPVDMVFEVVAFDPQDTVRLGLTAMPNAASGASGAIITQGTGTAQLDVTSGVAKASLAQILGTAITETSGQIAAAFKKWFDVATPTGTVNSIPNAVAGATGGLFIAGTNAATTVTTSFTTTFTGSLTGSVGSVTGAVGSVTGSVGSVTGAVGSVTGSVGSIATGGITTASFAAGAIDAAAIATDAIGSAELATSAITEIQSGLATSSALTSAASDITSIKTKTDFLPSATAGSAGGVFIAGTNASLAITGAFTIGGGLAITQSTTNQPAISATGNGTGQGASFTGGSGAAGINVSAGASSSSPGMAIAGGGSGTGVGLSIVGGGTSGVGISVTTTSGDGISILPTAGNGIVATANGTSKHGMVLTGSASGTGDGLKAVAGAGGVAYRGTLERCTLVDTTTTNTDMRGTNSAFLAASAPTNFSSLLINSSGHVSRCALVDTTTTNTDMRGTDSAALASLWTSTRAGYLDNLATAPPTAAQNRAEMDSNSSKLVAIKAVTDKVDTALVLDGAVYQFTVNALELGPSGGGASAASIADAVWDELMSGHAISGSYGERASVWASETVQSEIGNDVDSLLSLLGTVNTSVNSILADTNEVQLELANGGRLDLIFDATAASASSAVTSIQADKRIELNVDSQYEAAFYLAGTNTELFRKALLDANGDPIVDTATFVAEANQA